MARIVGIGGGTGLPVLLRGLTRSGSVSLSAIVCVSDDGGSSGMLRQAFGIPAVGDLRKCMVALANGHTGLANLFQHRFSGGNGLHNHSLGNLIMTALWERTGSLAAAMELATDLLHLEGRVLPATEASVTLCATFSDGARARGECRIVEARRQIEKIWLEPVDPRPTPGVLEAIGAADAVVLGPGSLYTSIISNLLVPGVAEALRSATALKIFVCNLMTQPGETDDFAVHDHLDVIEKYLGRGVVDLCVVNSRKVPPEITRRYMVNGANPVTADRREIARRNILPVFADLLRLKDSKVVHDSAKLGDVIRTLTVDALPARSLPEKQKMPVF